MKIPFHKPIMPNNLNDIYTESIQSGWLTTGPEVRSFESNLANIFNSNNVVCVNSCTAALHLALKAKGFGPEDKLIAPTYTFVATVEVGEYLGMQCELIDSDKEGFNIDLNLIEDKLKSDQSIRTIIPVHFAGEALDMKSLSSLANKYGVFILEDAAHAFEARTNIGKVGDTDYAAAFSFYANKNITTGGEGGALSTNDDKLADKVRKLSLHGISKDGWNRFKLGSSWRYDVTDLGFKYNMTDLSASIGNWQLKHYESWYLKRQEIIKKYLTGLKKIEGVQCPKVNFERHACHLFIIRIDENKWSISRDQLIQEINKKGIGTSVHYIPVHMHSYYQKKYSFNFYDYPNAFKLSKEVISLPLYPKLSELEVDYTINSICEIWEKFKA
jgi:dTDP-4-amino-4,6-dideoxygalactose transaminase